ncbi:MAG TPA: hypothetical protein VL484_13465 [Vicinamibacterales bacterium]|nr:hypothetical protein [Vicinamibacterales bacterium]
MATFFSAVLLALLAWRSGFSPWLLIFPVVVFAWLVWYHARVLRSRELATRAIRFYEHGLARLDDRWVGTGETGERFRNDDHVYANDLDLFGHGSLFELLSIARTRTGEAHLAEWLLAPADAPEIQERQHAVEELAPELDLREQLALIGADVDRTVQTDRLIDWAGSAVPSGRTLRLVTRVATAFMVFSSAYLVFTGAWRPLSLVILCQTLALRIFRDDIDAMLSAREPGAAAGFVADVLSHRSRDLEAVAQLLTHIERARFQSSRLVLLRSRLNDGGAASHIIRRLCRLADVHESQKNAAVFPAGLFLAGLYSGQDWLLALGGIVTGLLLLVRPHLALAVERWRRQHGPRVRLWIDAVAQFEALNSLACYRYERALDPFPEITPGPDGTALFDAVQLVHPLMPRATAVRNDVRLDDRVRLIVVSGSNMSGKSTLLRTVGTNVVLALAGGPVRAASLRLSPLALGATLRIQDSLLEGRSRFYAEITRIRTLVRIADGPLPLLFLLDELFHGTNSHDRLSGAQGVLRSLLARRAVGLITTHDLALTAIAAELAPHAVNVHFEDWFDDGAMKFDYRMRPGPVTRSNALALMRAVGLEVESGPEEARR